MRYWRSCVNKSGLKIFAKSWTRGRENEAMNQSRQDMSGQKSSHEYFSNEYIEHCRNRDLDPQNHKGPRQDAQAKVPGKTAPPPPEKDNTEVVVTFAMCTYKVSQPES